MSGDVGLPGIGAEKGQQGDRGQIGTAGNVKINIRLKLN